MDKSMNTQEYIFHRGDKKLKKHNGNQLQKTAAILLSILLIAGMVADAVPLNVLAKEGTVLSENTEAPESSENRTGITGEKKETEPEREPGGGTVEEPEEKTDTVEDKETPDEETGNREKEETIPGGQDGESGQDPADRTGQRTMRMAAAGKRDVTFTIRIYGYHDAYPIPGDLSKAGVIWEKNTTNPVMGENLAVGKKEDGYTVWQYLFRELEEGTRYGVKVEGASGQIGEFGTTGTDFGKDLYAVNFYDGDELEKVLYCEGGRMVSAEAAGTLEKEGHIFAGWVTADGSGEAFDFSNTEITHVTDVYASWTADTPPDDNIASGEGWVLAANGKLTITSDAGMRNWYGKRNTYKEDVKNAEIQNVENIRSYLFDGCKNLVSVTMSDDVKSMEEGVFYQCTSLTGITIPDSVTSIADHAFESCTSLTDVTMQGKTPPMMMGSHIFDYCKFVKDKAQGIHVPENCAEVYQNAAGWSTYKENITDGTVSHTHNLTLTPAKDATCTVDGNKAYYTCEGCSDWFWDAEGTQVIADKSSVVIAATGSGDNDRPGSSTSDSSSSNSNRLESDGKAEDDNNDYNSGYTSANSGVSGGSGGVTGTSASAPAVVGSTGTGQIRVKQENEGNIRKEVDITGEDTLDVSITMSLSELADIVLTGTERQQAAGGTQVRIVLDVQDASGRVNAVDRALVEEALKSPMAKGYALGQYLDINLYKVVGDSHTAITETNGKIAVTINVPDILKNTDSTKTRIFAVLRVHNARTELLADLDTSDDTVTIATDRFSTYAIVYQDAAGQSGAKDNEPETEDRTPVELCATLSMIAGLTYLLLYFIDRRHGMTEEVKKEIISRLVAWAKQGGRLRRGLALAAIFMVLVYYHSIGKKTCVAWKEVYGE